MEDFRGMSRKGQRSTTPTNMWEFSRNILLGKSYKSPSNEEGFDYKHDIPGKFIGKIDTNEEVVYFSIDGEFSCIGIYRTTDEIPVYIPILRSIYLGFKINRPIEGVFYYTFQQELLIAFSDGVFLDSNVPRLINLSNIGIDLTVDLELINPNDLNTLNLYPVTNEGTIDINYDEETSIAIDVVYITFTYVLPDGVSTTFYYPVQNVAYPTYNWTDEKKKVITVTLNHLDPNFNKVKLGLVVNNGNGLIGYESPVFSYLNQTVTITINSLSSYTETSVENLIIPIIYYNRIETMTLQNSRLVIGNLVAEGEIKIQKYVNQLELGLKFIVDKDENYTHPTLLPDEVYAVYLQPQFKSGTYGQAFALIGPEPNSSDERDILDQPTLNSLGLNNIAANEYKKFNIFNTGNFVLPPPYVETDEAHQEMKWGFWENEETYPNDDEFNSSIGYNGFPLGGEDYRNRKIKYFRVPGLDKIIEKVPCIIGFTHKNDEKIYGSTQDKFIGRVPKFGVYLKNYEEVFPQEVKDLLQGLRLLIVKRKTGDRLIEDISFAKQITQTPIDIEGTTRNGLITTPYRPRNDVANQAYVQFGYSKLWSNQLYSYKPAIPSKIIKANYALKWFRTVEAGIVPDQEATFDNRGMLITSPLPPAPRIDVLDDISLFKVKETQRFAEVKSIEYLPGNNIAASTPFIEESIVLTANNVLQADSSITGISNDRWNPLLMDVSTTTVISCVLDKYNSSTRLYEPTDLATVNSDEAYTIAISSTLINLTKNLYSGFSPDEFISLGRINTSFELSTKVLDENGDIFTNNIIKFPVTYNTVVNQPTNLIRFAELFIKGSFSASSNSSVYISKDRVFYTNGFNYLTSGPDSMSDQLLGFNYTPTIFNKEQYRSLNDLMAVIPFNINSPFISYFPFRVARTPKIPNENIQTNFIRTFRTNDYYEMLNNRGEVIAVRGTNKSLYIQQKFSLFLTNIKDTLTTSEGTNYLGEGDIFDRTPTELFSEGGKGYIGSTSKFACNTFKDGYVTIDQTRGKIFLINQGIKEISNIDMGLWFSENLDTSFPYYTYNRLGKKRNIDNPFTQIGHIIGYDDKYDRLLFTKKMYEFKYPEYIEEGIFTFDGEYYYDDTQEEPIRLDYNNLDYFIETSKTLSYNTEIKQWVCEHDYFPNGYFYTNKGLYLITNNVNIGSKTYKHNSKLNKGIFFGKRFESYIDLPFNNRLDLEKLYQNVNWTTQVTDDKGINNYFKTIDSIMCYTDFHCTGVIDIFSTEFNIARNNENKWNFNNFRDIAVDKGLPLLDNNGVINVNNLNINRSWFDKSNFIHTFIVVRMIMKNLTNDSVYIHGVNVKSRMSDRT